MGKRRFSFSLTHTVLPTPDVSGCLPHQAILRFFRWLWVSHSLTQLGHCLPGDGVRCHRGRAQPRRTASRSHHVGRQSQVQAVNWASNQLAINQGFPRPHPGVQLIG